MRKGDPEEYTKQFTEKNCLINEHQYGYRSVHYLIKSQPSKELFITELQVRTIFEEGWSEIDHNIRYPYDLENVILAQVSAIHNRLAGSADEIGSFIKILKKELQDRDCRYTSALEEQDKLLEELNEKIATLEITEAQKEDLEKRLKLLSSKAMLNLVMPDFSLIAKAIANITFPAIDPTFINTLKVAQQKRQMLESKTPPTSENKKDNLEVLGPQQKNNNLTALTVKRRTVQKRKTEKKN